MDQTRVLPASRQDLFDSCLLAECRLAHEFDLNAMLLRQPLGIRTYLIPVRFCESWVVEDPHLMRL